MKASSFLRKNSALFFATILFFVSFQLSKNLIKPMVVLNKQDETWNLNDKMIQNFSFGFKRLTSSLLWISTILESDIDHYKNRDLNSWMFLRFNTIALLEPDFYENYSFGGVYLSIIKDDIEGASIIFNKGLERFPTDFPLLRDASYHFFFEAKDFNRAYQVTQLLKKNYPNKLAMMGMTTKLEAENGRLEDALKTLDQYQKNYPVGSIIGNRILRNRYAVKAEIDLNCLNNQATQDIICSKFDLLGSAYIKTSKGYMAQIEWIPYRRKK